MFRERFEESLEGIRMSPIVSISEEVRRRAVDFEKSGKTMLRFQRGEIDLRTPEYITDALREALDLGLTKYPKSGGEDHLKQAIIGKLERDFGVAGIAPRDVVVTFGGQQGLVLAFKLFASGAGFSPAWSTVLENYTPYAQIEFEQVPLNEDFSIDYDKVEAAVRGRDFFYLNNPQNPTGKVFTRDELERVLDICTRHDCFVISDEAYEKFVFDGLRHVSLTEFDQENVLSVFTFSKTFSMTGWRVGYVVTRNERIAKLLRLGGYTQTAGVTSFVQYAAAKALDDVTSCERAVSEMKAEFDRRREALYDGLKDLPGVRVAKPQGAFYMFPNFTAAIPPDRKGEAREKYIYELLMESGIACVYGACFGKHFSDNVRLSYSATPVGEIEDAAARFKQIFSARTAA